MQWLGITQIAISGQALIGFHQKVAAYITGSPPVIQHVCM